MEEQKESPQGKRKIMHYVRLIFVTAFSLLFLLTIIMAVARKLKWIE